MRHSTCLAVTLAASSPVFASCSNTDAPAPYTDAEISLIVNTYDLQTGIHPDAITIELRSYSPWETREEFEAAELPSWNENFRVVRWPDATPVEGRWTFAADTHRGQMQFVPTRAFEDGWYAVQLRPDRLSVPRGFYNQVGPAVRDGWATARFHVGSFPLLLLSGGVGGDLTLAASEPVFAGNALRSTDIVAISVDGRPLACSSVPEGLEAGGRVGALGFNCPDPGPRASLTIEVRPLDWRTESGSTVRPCGTRGTGTWEAFTGEYIYGDRACDLEALLRAEALRAEAP